MKSNCCKIFFLFSFFPIVIFSQAETRNWFFGNNAGLTFTSNNTPAPFSFTGSAINATAGISSVSDALGITLFYSDGATVYNQTNAVMANGTGLFGANCAQSSIIIKQPASSNLYYVFTVKNGTSNPGFYYSIVDMSLASGMGSVTVKNATLFAGGLEEKLTAVKHCNQTDYWVMVRSNNSSNFRSYLLNSSGVSTTAVISPVSVNSNTLSIFGAMKFSPNGKRVAVMYTVPTGTSFGVTWLTVERYNYDNSTGVVSTPTNGVMAFSMTSPLGNNWGYGVEFSPGSNIIYYDYYNVVSQWNQCGFTTGNITPTESNFNDVLFKGALQLGPNKKIYVARPGEPFVGVINNPNVVGAGCNYNAIGPSLGTGSCQYGLPNFPSSYFEQAPSPISFSLGSYPSCLISTFEAPTVCPSTGYTLSTRQWNFGDISSGVNNTSNQALVTHTFSSGGTYTVRLVSNYYCCKPDTQYQVVTVTNPTINVSSTFTSCTNLTATVTVSGGIGPYTYLWVPSSQTTQVANLNAGVYSVYFQDTGGGCSGMYSANALVSPIAPTVTTYTNNCSNVGSASLNIGGGSGNYTYTWSTNTSNTNSINGLSTGTYSVLIFDTSTSCSVVSYFQIPILNASLSAYVSASAYSACVGSSVVLTAGLNGGNSNYNFNWVNGPANANYTVTQNNPGATTYTFNGSDSNSCIATKTISIAYASVPIIAANNAAICVGAVATLSASGANLFYWYPGGFVSPTFTCNPLTTTNYTVVGNNNGCEVSKLVSVVVNTLPVISVNFTNAICVGQGININSSGGGNYLWTGPSGFTSSLQNILINSASMSNAGIYSLVVTSPNQCSSSTSLALTILASPNLSVTGNFNICFGQVASLHASGANTYNWINYSSSAVLNINPNANTNYTLTGAFTNGCTSSTVVAVTVSECNALNEIEIGKGFVKLFPNPAKTTINLEITTNLNISIFDDLGKKLLSEQLKPGTHQFNISSFDNGVYFIKIENDFEYKLARFIKGD